jgi:hypothetical protein
VVHENDTPGVLNSHSRWQTNGAGFHFNQNYGFGLINADALARLATEFSGVTPREFSSTPLVNVSATLADATSLSRQINVNSSTPSETVQVFLDITHPVRGDLEAYLSSPAGTPAAGEKPTTDGTSFTANEPVLIALPAGCETRMRPVVAPGGTVAVIRVADSTAKVAAAPLKSTPVAPKKFAPEITTSVPTGPLVGTNAPTKGARVTVKLPGLDPVPAAVLTDTGPVLAPAGTIARISSADTTSNSAFTPLKRTATAPDSFVPTTVTSVPTAPVLGESDAIVGGAVGAMEIGWPCCRANTYEFQAPPVPCAATSLTVRVQVP